VIRYHQILVAYFLRDVDGFHFVEYSIHLEPQPIINSDTKWADFEFQSHQPIQSALSGNQQLAAVEIFEPILSDANGNVTSGLLSAVG
jgi:hypothetical protein